MLQWKGLKVKLSLLAYFWCFDKGKSFVDAIVLEDFGRSETEEKKTTIKEEDNEEEERGKEIENDDGQLYYVSKTWACSHSLTSLL